MSSPAATPARPERTDAWPEQLAVKVARCYYELGMTQQDIADTLGLGRARVIRLLAEARERGVVNITIDSPLLENVELAERLCARFSLDMAEVCLSAASDEQALAAQVGAAAGPVVLQRLHSGMTIGLGWGISLKEFASRLPRQPLSEVSVVALLGSLTRRSAITRFEATTDLAACLAAECLYLPAPIICDSEASRAVLIQQPMVADVHRRARDSDIAIVSIGGVDSSTIREVDLITEAEYGSVLDCGAIGNFLGYYIDGQARIVDHPINRRIISIGHDDFHRIPERIMLSAGPSKVPALKAVLEKGFLTGMITDQRTAWALLDEGVDAGHRVATADADAVA